MKKNIHFFGCSLTAGDELSDDVWFPWKAECNTNQEFIERRHPWLLNFTPEDTLNYHQDNKNLAYPYFVADDKYETFNHAANGASLRSTIFLALQLIYTTQVDVLFVQIPPAGREMYMKFSNHVDLQSLTLDDLQSLTLARPDNYEDIDIKNYIIAKNMSHNYIHYSLDDMIDLLMFVNVVKQKKIPLGIIVFNDELERRLLDLRLSPDFNFIRDNFYHEVDNLINFAPIKDRYTLLLGGHSPKEAHIEMANEIKNILPKLLNSTNE